MSIRDRNTHLHGFYTCLIHVLSTSIFNYHDNIHNIPECKDKLSDQEDYAQNHIIRVVSQGCKLGVLL